MVDFKKELFYNAFKNRIPLTATIELISECNFRCVHCYIDHSARNDFLSYDQVVDFGEQIIAMGCLYVILTGGEVLLHPDFKRIYTFFAIKGVCISVFTNGSLITEEVLALFKKYPPRLVEVTMYGYSSDTYFQVTRKRMFEDVKRNILLLIKNNINVLLKMFVMKENYPEFDSIRQFAISCSIPFKYDTRIISPKNSHELTHQLDDDISLKLGISKSSTVVKYNEETYDYIVGERSKKIFQCGAGRSTCWLKSNFRLRLCNFLSCIEYDLNIFTVNEAWELMGQKIDDNVPKESKCYNCKYRKFCNYCPAISFISFGRTDLLFRDPIYCKNAKIKASIDNIEEQMKVENDDI